MILVPINEPGFNGSAPPTHSLKKGPTELENATPTIESPQENSTPNGYTFHGESVQSPWNQTTTAPWN